MDQHHLKENPLALIFYDTSKFIYEKVPRSSKPLLPLIGEGYQKVLASRTAHF